MKDFTIVVDGNYFIYSRMFVLPRPKQIPGLPTVKFMDEEKDVNMLVRKLAIDFASETRKFKNIAKRIVFTLDAKSWRKDLFPNADYKGNRENDPTMNWANISRAMKDFSDILSSHGVIVERLPGAEGDDLIFSWATHLNSIGENCIIWSGDTDLMQLVNYNRSNDSFTIWYDNTRSKIAAYPGFKKWLESKENDKTKIDIFSPDTNFYLIDKVKEEIEEFIKRGKLSVEEIYCDEYVFQKILTGDKGDNIASVLVLPAKKPGSKRMNKVNDTKAKSILDTFKKRHKRFSSIYLFEDTYKDEIVQLVSREMKVKGRTKEIKQNLELNTQLILLHVSTIPDAIQKSMFDRIKSDCDNGIELAIENLLDKDKMLKGTKFIDPSYSKNNRNEPPKGAIGALF